MDKDLSIEKWYRDFWKWRQKNIKTIYDIIGLNDRRLRTCHGMQVLNSKVLQSLKNEFMEKNNISYKDIIELVPFEFTWYNIWFQKSKLINEVVTEPFFKIFHRKTEYVFSRMRLIKISDIADAYIGIILNSNWNLSHGYKNPDWLCKIIYFICFSDINLKIIKRIITKFMHSGNNAGISMDTNRK